MVKAKMTLMDQYTVNYKRSLAHNIAFAIRKYLNVVCKLKMTSKIIISVFLSNAVFSTTSTFAQQINKSDLSKLIVGQWIKKIDKTKDGKEYIWLKCKDTIRYLQSGQYIWKQCGINETGKWKISANKKMIILYQRKCKYWEDYLQTKDIGQKDIPIVSMTRLQLVTVIYDEEKGAVNQFYSRTQ